MYNNDTLFKFLRGDKANYSPQTREITGHEGDVGSRRRIAPETAEVTRVTCYFTSGGGIIAVRPEKTGIMCLFIVSEQHAYCIYLLLTPK